MSRLSSALQREGGSLRSASPFQAELSHYVRKLRLSVYSPSCQVTLDQSRSLLCPLFSKEESCSHLGY